MTSLYSAYDKLGLPVYVVDLDSFEIIYVNEKCIDLLGEITGLTCHEVLNGTSYICKGCIERDKLELNNSCSTKARYLAGVDKYVDTYESLIKLPDGRNARLCLISDVTEQEHLRIENAEREIAREKMQHLIDMQGSFIKSAKSMMGAASFDGKFIFINDIMIEALGYSKDEVEDMEISDFHTPEAAKNIMEKFIPVALSKGEYKGENVIKRKDGSTFPIRQMVFPVKNDAGETIAMATIMDDITEEKEMELQNRYQLAIMESSRNYIGVSDLDGNTIYHNPGAYRMRGFESDDSIEWTRAQPHPEWYAKLVKDVGIPSAMKEGQWLGRGEIIDRHGRHIPVDQSIFPVFDDDKNIMGIATIIQDVSEKVEHEKEIEAGRRMLRAIIDTAPSAIFWKDRDSKFLGANRQFAKEAGFDDPDELIGMSDYDFYPKEIADMYVADDNKAFETGKEMFHFEEPFQGADGVTHWISTSKVLIRDEEGNPYALLGLYDDITKLKQNEKKLEEAIEIAEEANHAKSEFLSRMSHEIRTPMNAIIGMTKIGHDASDPEKMKYCLEKIDTASKHLLSLINDILDMSKIEANKKELFEDDFDFERMLENARSVINVKAEEKNQKLTFNIKEDVPSMIKADEMRIAQVITNLLSNAVKFTPDGGNIDVEVINDGETADGRIKLSVSVTDDGIGLTENQISKLFKSFEQADVETSRTYGGTGLGLAISKRFVEMMDGDVSVTSKKGEGSTFLFTIPVKKSLLTKENVNEMLSNTSSDHKGIFSGVNIMLAEDIDINQEIVIALLEETEINIDCVSNGEEAVRLFSENQNKYDLIIMDVQMPVMNGLEATKKIKDLGTDASDKIPIIAMTANAFSEDVNTCIEVGMVDHIGKPIDIDLLIGTLKKFIK